MAFANGLEHQDGTPADPPTFRTNALAATAENPWS
jgi:hypothetical protein